MKMDHIYNIQTCGCIWVQFPCHSYSYLQITKVQGKRNFAILFFLHTIFNLQYWRLYLLTLVLGIGGSFQFGMQISVIASPAVVRSLLI